MGKAKNNKQIKREWFQRIEQTILNKLPPQTCQAIAEIQARGDMPLLVKSVATLIEVGENPNIFAFRILTGPDKGDVCVYLPDTECPLQILLADLIKGDIVPEWLLNLIPEEPFELRALGLNITNQEIVIFAGLLGFDGEEVLAWTLNKEAELRAIQERETLAQEIVINHEPIILKAVASMRI